MIFTEPIFGVFIVVVMLCLGLVKSRHAAIWLIIVSSAIFYGWWNVSFLLLLAAAAVVDFFLGLWIGACRRQVTKKIVLTISICWNLGLLAYFKYTNFLIENINEFIAFSGGELPLLNLQSIVLPIGISFFTFETLCYSIDIYRGDFKPIRKLHQFLLFISFFPHLVAGPIVRGADFLPQIQKDFLGKRDSAGLFLVIFGLAKKTLLADPLGQFVVDPAFSAPSDYGSIDLVFAVYCYAFQIFLDFSGYTDMAIGLARMMGIDLGINFNAPYLARSFTEFWRRWHISLSTWFRDYVFLPLGGSRVSMTRLCFNLMIVFLVSGLWHGANWRFMIWGGLHGLFLVAETLYSRWRNSTRSKPNTTWRSVDVLKTILVFHFVCLAWIFFRAESLNSALEFIRSVFNGNDVSTQLAGGMPLILCLIATISHISMEPWKNQLTRWFHHSPALVKISLIWVIFNLIFNQSLQSIGHRAFIYFQF